MKNIGMFCLIFLVSCSGVSKEMRKTEIGETPKAEASVQVLPEEALPPAVQVPSFRPISEDISPLNKRIISISVRNAALRDVAKIVSDAAQLNLVMEKGVNPDAPVTVTLNHVNIKNALDILFSSVDYFYEVRNNLLVIKAQDTRIFELGHPSMINNYSVSLGGDILGGTSSGASGGSSTGTAASSTTTATNLKGDVKIEGKTSEESQDLWKAVSESISDLIKTDEAGLKPSFSINRITGTIMVTASKGALEKVKNFLDKTRESLNRQVMIEARIVEVQLSDSLMYGIDWEFIKDWQKVGQVSVGTSSFNSVVSSTGPSFQFGITGVDSTMLLKALQTQGNVNVLSNPRVSLMNGQTAMLSVGRNTNFISRVQTTTSTSAASTGVVTFTIETSSILSGLIIGIVPYINSDGNVSMTITPIVTDLISLEEKALGTVGTNNVSLSLPTVDLREMSTTVRVKDGEMIIIGGLINRKESDRESGVPFLSKVPMIGSLFKTTEKVEQRTELVIMLKPMVEKAE
ncbi:MAG: pilus (MSHA type) biogenesis protein MshL [Nitrospirae bacterium CG2_30_53_67]|nr:MAG: pilus (MSHA type) biogenesis protein MshL [Nitrospirae bacterium CG2_30_53_67]